MRTSTITALVAYLIGATTALSLPSQYYRRASGSANLNPNDETSVQPPTNDHETIVSASTTVQQAPVYASSALALHSTSLSDGTPVQLATIQFAGFSNTLFNILNSGANYSFWVVDADGVNGKGNCPLSPNGKSVITNTPPVSINQTVSCSPSTWSFQITRWAAAGDFNLEVHHVINVGNETLVNRVGMHFLCTDSDLNAQGCSNTDPTLTFLSPLRAPSGWQGATYPSNSTTSS